MADVATCERTSAELAPMQAQVQTPMQAPTRKPSESASVAELVNAILDKGIVIDAWASVPVLGLELLSIEARVVVVSVATYLRYAETMRLSASKPPEQVVEALPAGGAGRKRAGRTARPRSRA